MLTNHRDHTSTSGRRLRPVIQPGTIVRTSTALAVAAAVAWASAAPAAAHNVLIDSTPSEGSTIESQPGTVELVFDQFVQDDFAQVAVLDADENPFHSGEPVVDVNVVTQEVDDLPDGDYTIAYRVISADGHPVSGTVEFSVAAGMAPPDEDPADEDPADADTSVDGTTIDRETTTGTSDDTDEGLNGTVVTGLIVFAVLAGLALITARNRRRLRQSSLFDDGTP